MVIAGAWLLPASAFAGDFHRDARGIPNIILILADDLGYSDLGCFGQKLIQTPCLDRMADEGMRFTDFYAGSTVCAPSRCVLMTGRHLGHSTVRGNADPQRQSLTDEDVTVAELLRGAGYATAIVGKWGLGEHETPGMPTDQGFDYFFGYLNQAHAHNYYPEFLFRNKEKVPLRNVLRRDGKPYEQIGAGLAITRLDYSHDLLAAEALEFVDKHKDRPFFLYLALTIPHANNEAARLVGNGQEVPDYGIYAGKDWPDPDKGQAAMITRMDADVGRLFERLKEHGIDHETIVLFSSDNGNHNEGGHNTERFDPNGPLRGMKRDLYEGGIRVPTLVRWPGRVAAGTTTDHVGYFGDFMATAADLAGVEPPEGLDSISFLPTLLGQNDKQKEHDYLYWEFYEQGTKQAVRRGKWKAVRRPMLTGRIELYDLAADLGEENDVAAEHADLVARMEAIMAEAHVPSPRWTVEPPTTKQR
ncbi:MAG: N-acetylgalactosamine-6-sulfatase [Planctomycetes bacterium RBG_16_64_12]|nr:MAG: N-acetylgalactosamine-6-sulfatase [Planctomycetes bacterium RBG_16_64_12]